MRQSVNIPFVIRKRGSKKREGKHIRGIARRGSVGIVHQAFHDAASWEPPYPVVEVSWLVVGPYFLENFGR